jgi:DNA-directed RNA polymerase specialized sigma24 family protein
MAPGRTDNKTSMGGRGGRFGTTHWTAIQALRSSNATQRQTLMDELFRTYGKPVYCYLRRKGYGNEEAQDLVQGFFQEVVLGRELIDRADPTKGRFRTLLLTALDRYAASEHRKQTAQKRLPPRGLVALEWTEMAELPEPVATMACEDSYHYTWVSELLDRVLAEVKDSCMRHGMEIHWKLFNDRVLQPLLSDVEPPSLADLCAACGIEEATTASNMIFTVKKRLQSALRQHLRQSVADETEIGEEMSELARFLNKKRQYAK